MVGLAVPGSNEAYEKLFNPQWGTVRSKQGVCSALAYLLSSFLDLRRNQKGNLADGPRVSLRLALSALAMHSVFDETSQEEYTVAPVSLSLSRCAEEEALEEDHGKAADHQDEQQQFRSLALALICVLDAALSWRPADPLGWTGSCEDSEGAALIRERGLCSFQFVAGRLRKALKKATNGSQVAWRRLEVHLDAVRSRELPEPWPWVWTLNEEASMLVRNRTKVELRVELYKPRSVHPSPWDDWPFIINILRLFRGNAESDPVLVAKVGPGIEWALRPRTSEGREFKVRLLTKSGVVVNSRHIRRGQSVDFEVPVPPPPARLRVAAFAERSKQGARRRRAKSKQDHQDASEVCHEEREGSVCSTNAPSQLSFGTRTSFASTAGSGRSYSSTLGAGLSVGSSVGSADGHREAQQEILSPAHEQFQAKMVDRRRLVEGLGAIESEQEEEATSDDEEDSVPAVRGLLKEDEGFHTGICPRCLHNMPLRCHRPLASIYQGGVSCDHCGVQMLGGAGEDDAAELQAQNSFCHCSRCWFDLCRACAWKEMQETWWDGE